MGGVNSVVTARAIGGFGQTHSGDALARATGTGSFTSSSANAYAASGSGGVIQSVSSNASAPLNGTSVVEGQANVAGPARSASQASGLQAAAYATGLPQSGDLNPIFAATRTPPTTSPALARPRSG